MAFMEKAETGQGMAMGSGSWIVLLILAMAMGMVIFMRISCLASKNCSKAGRS